MRYEPGVQSVPKLGPTDFMVTKSKKKPYKTVSSNLLKIVVSFLRQRHPEIHIGPEGSHFECGLTLLKEEGVSTFCHFSYGRFVRVPHNTNSTVREVWCEFVCWKRREAR